MHRPDMEQRFRSHCRLGESFIYGLASHHDDVSTGQPDAHLRCEIEAFFNQVNDGRASVDDLRELDDHCKAVQSCLGMESLRQLLRRATGCVELTSNSVVPYQTKCAPASQMKEGLKDAVECVAELKTISG